MYESSKSGVSIRVTSGDEGSLESGDDGVCSNLADSVGLPLRLDSARFQCTSHSLESLVLEMVSLVADLLRFVVSRSAFFVP